MLNYTVRNTVNTPFPHNGMFTDVKIYSPITMPMMIAQPRVYVTPFKGVDFITKSNYLILPDNFKDIFTRSGNPNSFLSVKETDVLPFAEEFNLKPKGYIVDLNYEISMPDEEVYYTLDGIVGNGFFTYSKNCIIVLPKTWETIDTLHEYILAGRLVGAKGNAPIVRNIVQHVCSPSNISLMK